MPAADHRITDEARLEEVLGAPLDFVHDKVLPRLNPAMMAFIGRSPLVFVGTIDDSGHPIPIKQGGLLNLKAMGLFVEKPMIRSRGQTHHLEPVRVLGDDIESLGTDAASGTQNDDSLHRS